MNSRKVLNQLLNVRLLGAISLLSFSLFFGEACTKFNSLHFESTSVTNGTGSSGDSSQNSPIQVPTPPTVNCSQPGMRGAANPGIRRLNQAELLNTLHGVLPFYSTDLENSLKTYSDLVDMTDVTSFQQVYSTDQMQQWSLITDLIATTIVNSPNGTNARAAVGGACFAADAITDACWTSFFTTFGKKVYRHPLADTDVAFLKNAITGLTTSDAVYQAVTLLFRSPDFLFHLESGSSTEANRVRLTDYEVANRISYAITGKSPDANLLAAADNAQLETVAQVEAQARRLLATPDAQTNLTQFFSNWLEYDRFATPDYAITSLSTGITWGSYELTNDINAFLKDVFWSNPGGFNDLMTRKTVFPSTDSLKIAYNTSGYDPTGNTPFTSPDHPGLVTRLGFLSQQGAVSNPIQRGVFVMRRLLCNNIPTPDFSIVALRDAQLGSLSGMDYSNTDLIKMRTSAPVCMGCHAQINPIGFALEGFDVFGKSRSVEAYVDWSNIYADPKVPYYNDVTYDDPVLTAARAGQMVHGALHPLPYPVANVTLASGQMTTINSPSDLTTALGNSADAAACISNFVLREFQRRLETAGDSCQIQEAAKALQNGAPVLDVFVRMLASEDIFWRGI